MVAMLGISVMGATYVLHLELVSLKDALPFLSSCKKNRVFEKFFGNTFFTFFNS